MLRGLFIFYTLFSLNIHSQNSIFKSSWNELFYKEYNSKNFKNFSAFNETIDLKNIDYPLLHAAIYYTTNLQRSKRNIKHLKWNLNLEIAAYNHSKNMVVRNFFDHLSNKEVQKRGKSAGILNPYLSENIAKEFALNYNGHPFYTHEKNSSLNGEFRFSYNNNEQDLIPTHTYLSFAFRIVEMWMNSTSHRKNILDKKAIELGVGVYFKVDEYGFPLFYATQNFQRYNLSEIGESKSPLPPGW